MRNIKSLWGVVWVLLIALFIVSSLLIYRLINGSAGGAVSKPDNPNTVDPIVATIGGHNIKQSELSQNLYDTFGSELLKQMLDHQAIQMEADEMGLKLDRSEIDQELIRMQQGYESEEQFYKSMKEQVGLTKGQLREDVYYRLLLEKIATKNITVSDADVNVYIKSHSEEFRDTVQLRIQQIISDSLQQAQVTLEKLAGGSDFAEVARERSLDTATANDGGDLGWVEENDPFVPAPILKSAKGLRIGEISKPIDLGNNKFAVIKLKDRKESSKGSKEQIRQSVRRQLALQRARPLKEITQELRQKRNAVIYDKDLQ